MEWIQLEYVISYGIFATLFVGLLIYTNKRNEARETKYQEMIEKNQSIISEQATALTSLAGDVKEVKYILKERNR